MVPASPRASETSAWAWVAARAASLMHGAQGARPLSSTLPPRADLLSHLPTLERTQLQRCANVV